MVTAARGLYDQHRRARFQGPHIGPEQILQDLRERVPVLHNLRRVAEFAEMRQAAGRRTHYPRLSHGLSRPAPATVLARSAKRRSPSCFTIVVSCARDTLAMVELRRALKEQAQMKGETG